MPFSACVCLSIIIKKIIRLEKNVLPTLNAKTLETSRFPRIVFSTLWAIDKFICASAFTGMFNIWHIADKIAAIARKEIFYVWPFGLAAYLAGVVFIDRNNSKDAYKQLKITSEVMIKNKVSSSIIIFLLSYLLPTTEEEMVSS